MSSNNYGMILIYLLPLFFPKTLHNFPSLWFKRKCSYIYELKAWCGHFLHQWTIQIICSSESEPRIHNGAGHPAFQAPPVILSHTVQLPSLKDLEVLGLEAIFLLPFKRFKVLAKKKKKNSIFYTILITLHFFSQILFSCFLRCHPHRCLAQNLFCGIMLILPWHSSPCYSLEL